MKIILEIHLTHVLNEFIWYVDVHRILNIEAGWIIILTCRHNGRIFGAFNKWFPAVKLPIEVVNVQFPLKNSTYFTQLFWIESSCEA